MTNGFREVQIEHMPLVLNDATGALVVYTPQTKQWAGASVELYAGADSYDFRDKQSVPLAPHRINGRIVSAAIFPALPAGSYRAFASGRHGQVSHVMIAAREVTEVHWR